MKGLISALGAIVTAVVLVYVVLLVFKFTFAILNLVSSIIIIGLVAVFALPIYVIIRKKLFS